MHPYVVNYPEQVMPTYLGVSIVVRPSKSCTPEVTLMNQKQLTALLRQTARPSALLAVARKATARISIAPIARSSILLVKRGRNFLPASSTTLDCFRVAFREADEPPAHRQATSPWRSATITALHASYSRPNAAAQ